MRRQRTTFALAVLMMVSACLEGGSNRNQRTPGNQDDGVGLGFGDIAVHPSGDYFLSRVEDDLLHGTIRTGKTRVLPGITNPQRLAFASRSRAVYVTTLRNGRGHINAYDVGTDSILWSHPIETSQGWSQAGLQHYPTLKVTSDDRYLILVYQDRIDRLDTSDGATRKTFFFNRDIIDVDLLETHGKALVTMVHEWNGDQVNAKVWFIDLESGHKHSVKVPNCSDEVAITPDERYAFLAPTTCRRDPVSVIDLHSERWVGNLPGFGPVAVAPRGNLAIAFLDRDNIDASLFDDPAQIPSSSDVRYHVMFIDTVTLEFETLAIGDTLPRYALTPAGNLVLVDSASWYEDGKLRLLDTATKEIRAVSGPDVRLNQFVMTSDSSRVFLLDQGLYDLSLWAARVQSVDLRFVPTNINITPDDKHLLLREDATTMWVFRVADRKLVHSMKVPGSR